MKNMLHILMGASVLALYAVGVQAQNISPSTPVETITVIAPYLVTEKPVAATKSNPRQKLFTVSMLGEAGYGDLDLSKPEGATRLKERVHDTAAQLCKRIEAQYPSSVYVPIGDQDCVKAAVQDAMVAVDILVTAYHHG